MVHAVFLLFQLGGNNFSVWKREHARPHTIDDMQKYSKTHVPIKVKNVLFVNYALFFANKKTILKALLKIWFCGNHDVHPNTIHQIPWRVSVQSPDGGYGCVPSDPVTETLEDSTFGGNLWRRNTADFGAGH